MCLCVFVFVYLCHAATHVCHTLLRAVMPPCLIAVHLAGVCTVPAARARLASQPYLASLRADPIRLHRAFHRPHGRVTAAHALSRYLQSGCWHMRLQDGECLCVPAAVSLHTRLQHYRRGHKQALVPVVCVFCHDVHASKCSACVVA